MRRSFRLSGSVLKTFAPARRLKPLGDGSTKEVRFHLNDERPIGIETCSATHEGFVAGAPKLLALKGGNQPTFFATRTALWLEFSLAK